MDDTSLLATFQLADSFFPSGMVTLSHGLETFLSLNPPATVNLPRLLTDYLNGKVAPCDLIAYAQAHRAAESMDTARIQDIDHLLTAALTTQDLRQGSLRSGRAMLDTLRPSIDAPVFQHFAEAVRDGQSAGNAAVCFAVVCAAWRIPLRAGALLLLYTFSVSFLGAALRLGALGHREAQRILTELRPHFPALVDTVLDRDLEELSAFAPLADIHAMQHAYIPVRLFSS